MRENMILPHLEEVAHYRHIGVVLVVHLVQTLNAYAVELADSIKSANANAASPIDLNAFSQASSIDFVISLVNSPASLTPNK